MSNIGSISQILFVNILNKFTIFEFIVFMLENNLHNRAIFMLNSSLFCESIESRFQSIEKKEQLNSQ
jgi:hypothetical protein